MKKIRNPNSYVAFLRGINVGGNHKVRMEELRKCFKELGFDNVSTISVAGNVLFEGPSIEDIEELSTSIERLLKKAFKFDIPVSVRTISSLQKLYDSEPFKGIEVTEQTRLYVTFFSGYIDKKFKLPFTPDKAHFTILRVTDSEMCSVLTIDDSTSSPDLMVFVDKQFGKRSTTRNLNTIRKVLEQDKINT